MKPIQPAKQANDVVITKSNYEQSRIFMLHNKTFLRVIPELATEIGLNECLMLLQLEFLIATSGKDRDGQLWVYESVTEWKEQLPFLSKSTINRTINNLIALRLINVSDQYNKKKYDRTRWFALNLENCSKLKGLKIRGGLLTTNQYDSMQGSSESDGSVLAQDEMPLSQNDMAPAHIDTVSTQIDTTIPENSTEIQTNTSTESANQKQTQIGKTLKADHKRDEITEKHNQSIVASREFVGFFEVALQTCEVNSQGLEKYLGKVVRELIAEGFTAQDAQIVDEQWNSVWPGTTRLARVKEYRENFASLLDKHKAAAQYLEDEAWAMNAPLREMERREAELQRESEANAARLLADREANGLPPIHCNCKDGQGNYLVASVEGHKSCETSWFRCHHFKRLDSYYRNKVETECGFEIRAGDIDILAPQPEITLEQCQQKDTRKGMQEMKPHPASAFANFDLASIEAAMNATRIEASASSEAIE